MDKYEFNIKVEQIKKLMKKKDFVTAVKIADTIDWYKVKENQLLIMAADVYEIAGRYDPARDALLTAYERTGLGRQLAYRLCRLSVKRGDMTEAQEFYEEFTENSPRDAGKYILQYEMAKGKGEPLAKQIEILETYIEEDMDDRWAFELAKLYHKAQLREKCVELCDTIILWFADGKYVEKALELKQLYVPLSENQRLKYEAQKSRKSELNVNPMAGNTAKLVEEAIEKSATEEFTDKDEPVATEGYVDEAVMEEPQAEKNEIQEGEILDKVTEIDFDVNAVHFKDYSVNNKYDTLNIQRELAMSVSSFVDKTQEIFKPVTKASVQAEENADAVDDDQIEGQMSLEEVLAMFESGELQTRKEESEDAVEQVETELQEVTETIAEEEDIEEVSFEEEISEEDVEEITIEEAVDAEAFEELEEVEESEAIEAVDIESEDEIETVAYEEDELESVSYEEDELESVSYEEDELESVSYEEDELESVSYEEDELEAVSYEEEDELEAVSYEEEEKVEASEELVTEEEPLEEMSGEEILAEIVAGEIIYDMTNEQLEEQTEEETLVQESEEIEEYTYEEDSEDAESGIQENEPNMFDLKDAAIGEEAEVQHAEEEAVEESEDNSTEPEEVAVEEESATEESEEQPASKKYVIQSEHAKEELKKFISRFAGVQGLDKQIIRVMQGTLKADTAPVKFIFVKGEVKSGKTTLAVDVIKLANKLIQRRDQKIAKIKGEKLNGKSVDALLSKLGGSDVLIERVSDMEPDTFVEFIDKLRAEAADRFVIFEDERSLADAFLAKVPEGYNEFANTLDIRQNKIKDWAKMASDYALSQGYAFDEMGILALSAKIDQLRAITLVVHKNHVEQLVDGAIKKSNKFSLRKLFGRAKNEDGMVLLTEKDFID